MGVQAVEDGPWCWRCMEARVPQPLLLCDICAWAENRPEPEAEPTSERSHERRRADLAEADMDAAAMRVWRDLTEN